ncbi:MAG: hypothetical protein WCN95_15765 [bacterium]
MNDTIASTILILICVVVVVSNVVIFGSFRRKLRNIEDSIHKRKP